MTQQILWKLEQNRRVDRLCDRRHHICAEDPERRRVACKTAEKNFVLRSPENIIDEKAAEHDDAGFEAAKMQIFDAVD